VAGTAFAASAIEVSMATLSSAVAAVATAATEDAGTSAADGSATFRPSLYTAARFAGLESWEEDGRTLPQCVQMTPRLDRLHTLHFHSLSATILTFLFVERGRCAPHFMQSMPCEAT
jgi:hypothetical protein